MDIVLITYGIFILVNVVIINLICANLVSRATFSREVVAAITVQVKVVSYYERHFKDDFIPLTVEILNVYTKRRTISFINVPTWHGR
jgi:hypothetical protein